MTREIDEIVDRFAESYSSEVTMVGDNTGVKKFGSSGHLCIRSIFAGSCDGYVVIPAGEIAQLGQALIKIAKENASVKAEIERQKKLDEQNNRTGSSAS